MKITSDGTEIFYEVQGSGAPVVLLHPFPASHHFWDGCVPFLDSRYQLILPDLRGHGDSQPGDGPATMTKHAHDLERLCHELGIGKASFAGVSIGGYVLFEFWRKFRDRVSALVLADTRAGADTTEGRAAREKSAQDVQLRGSAQFVESMLPKLLGQTTLQSRLDQVEAARAMISRTTVPGIVAVQQGMASRPDSIVTLKTISVPTLIIAGREDALTPLPEAQLMHQQIRGSRLETVPQAGHYAAFEQPEHFGKLLRGFLDGLKSAG